MMNRAKREGDLASRLTTGVQLLAPGTLGVSVTALTTFDFSILENPNVVSPAERKKLDGVRSFLREMKGRHRES